MKKLRIIALIGILAILAVDVFAFPPRKLEKHRNRPHHEWRKGPVVHAPLDGAILVLLAAAGGAYYLIRKKKKN